MLQLPAPALLQAAPGTGVALPGILSLLQVPEQRTNHPWLSFSALQSSAIASRLGFPM